MPDEPGSSDSLVDAVMEIIDSRDREHAVQLLDAANGNLELAVALHFGEDLGMPPTTNEPPPPVADLANANGAFNFDRNAPVSLVEELNRELVSDSAPRPPRQPLVYNIGLWPFAIITWPLRGVKSVLGMCLTAVTMLMPHLPRYLGYTTVDSPDQPVLETVAKRKVSLNCTKGPYLDALDQAKRDLKHLLVVLVPPYHENTLEFIATVEEAFTPEILRQTESIVWAGLTTTSEAYQLSSLLAVSEFPAVACIAPSPKTPQSSTVIMEVLARWPFTISNNRDATQLRQQLKAAVEVHKPRLLSLRFDRDRFAADRNIRADQDRAYEASLAADRERVQQQQQAAEQERQKQQQAERYAQNLEAYKQQRKAILLAATPAKGAPCCTVQLRLSDGSREIVRLGPEAPVKDLYDWVLCRESTESGAAEYDQGFEPRYSFELVSPMPRKVLPNSNSPVNQEKTIWPQGTVIVDTLDDDEEE